MSIASQLPTELYEAILKQVPPAEVQQTTLSLTRALPYSPIPQYFLFTSIRLTRSNQAYLLSRRLREAPKDASYVRSFWLNVWTVDADVVINLIRMLPRVKTLRMAIGPNFAPEHLDELFAHPFGELEYIALRFRPYVQKASYYQFLKGAYYDSSLAALARWPASTIPTLSIIQDPLDPKYAPQGQFAQPLVFFRLDAVSELACSPFAEDLANLRMRIPGRQLARFIYASPDALPSLDLLDLSTCSLRQVDVDNVLARFDTLQHLILDDCTILRGELRDEDWRALGKLCATVGIRRAAERERRLRKWIDAVYAFMRSESAAEPVARANRPNDPNRPRRAHRGRRGLATATISLRAAAGSSEHAGLALPTHIDLPDPGTAPTPRFRILPPVPTIRTICITPSALIPPEQHARLREQFELGWEEGLALLTQRRATMRTSYMNGLYRVVRFAVTGEDVEVEMSDEGLGGLVEVGGKANQIPEAFDVVLMGESAVTCPVLCLAGPGHKEGYTHAEGCGHAAGWDVYGDQL
ncbi:hypothetical protein DENSPDRAFT_813731 [Dentipellis sp. KUC8613]|nr:hypothetical protein DENSPDRAFT_813731 [Dentipellis sp. KUC8613]